MKQYNLIFMYKKVYLGIIIFITKGELTIVKVGAKPITYHLINWLDKKYTNKTITTEVSLNTSYGVKVVDVAVSNGHSIAFEIKSEADNTARLESQVKGYSEYFDYVYIVLWQGKHDIDSIDLPAKTGIIEVLKTNGNTFYFKVVKKAKINRNITPELIGHFLWVSELKYFLDQKEVKYKNSYDKYLLVKTFMDNYNKTEAIKIFRFVMKRRFEKGFKLFKKTKQLKAYKLKKVDSNYISKLKLT
ncbi:MAG: sce7726 family protein [Campylobacterota bacterium]